MHILEAGISTCRAQERKPSLLVPWHVTNGNSAGRGGQCIREQAPGGEKGGGGGLGGCAGVPG